MNNKELRLERKSKGLCPTCGGIRDNPNRLECNACAEKHSRYVKEANRYYQNLHICPVCKTNKLEGEQKRCPACKQMMKERHIRYGYDKNKISEYERIRREKFKSQGLCVICGKTKAVEGQTLCEGCKARAKKQRMERQRKAI